MVVRRRELRKEKVSAKLCLKNSKFIFDTELHYLLCDNIGSMELYQAIQAIVTCAFAVNGLGLLKYKPVGYAHVGYYRIKFLLYNIFFLKKQ